MRHIISFSPMGTSGNPGPSPACASFVKTKADNTPDTRTIGGNIQRRYRQRGAGWATGGVFGYALTSAACAVLLSACGGGGGGGGSIHTGGGGSGGSGGDSGNESAVTRAVPGYTVGATRLTPLIAGQPCTIRLDITPDAGQPAVQSVAGWLGTQAYAPPATLIQATPLPNTSVSWQVEVIVPDPLPADATVWLRLIASDGAVLEVGRSAFELALLPGD